MVEAVQGKVEVYLDGGIREGTDVFKALALGAKMVRHFLYEENQFFVGIFIY